MSLSLFTDMDMFYFASLIELIIICSLLSITDIRMTYRTIIRYSKLYPKKDATKLEINPLPKIMWKAFGIKRGTIIDGIMIVSALITLLILAYSLHKGFFVLFGGIVIGGLTMINIIHFSNSQILSKREKRRFGGRA